MPHMVRDKDYLRTREGLLFNVVGYDHAPGRATANLKYVGDRKWTDGYAAAKAFLQADFSHYVDRWIEVPFSHVTHVYRPQEGLRRLLAQSDRNPLEQTAVALAHAISDFFQIPLDKIGLTDSLLWGRGAEGSDIDLVVIGEHAASSVLEQSAQLLDQPDFERLGAHNFTRRPVAGIVPSDEACRRRTHKGLYRGVRFSLRAVRSESNIPDRASYRADGIVEMRGRVLDHSESLYFPAIYRLDSGVEVISFAMEYEARFRTGDLLAVCGTQERGPHDRIVVSDPPGEGQGMRVVETS